MGNQGAYARVRDQSTGQERIEGSCMARRNTSL